jgi:hypothetical protein
VDGLRPARGKVAGIASGRLGAAVEAAMPGHMISRRRFLHLFNLYTNPQEDEAKTILDSWVIGPVLKMVGQFEETLKKYPLIPMGTPDPYRPPASAR